MSTFVRTCTKLCSSRHVASECRRVATTKHFQVVETVVDLAYGFNLSIWTASVFVSDDDMLWRNRPRPNLNDPFAPYDHQSLGHNIFHCTHPLPHLTHGSSSWPASSEAVSHSLHHSYLTNTTRFPSTYLACKFQVRLLFSMHLINYCLFDTYFL